MDEASNPPKIWFIGLICFALLSTYLPVAIPSIIPLLVLVLGLVLAVQIQKLEISIWLKCIYYFLIIGSVVLSQREYIFIIVAALILQSTFNFKDAFSISCFLIAPILLITEIIAYWGFPFNTWLIWYWGLPFIILSFAIAFFLKKETIVPLLILATGVCIIINTFFLYNSNSNIKLVQSSPNSSIEGISLNLIRNLSDSTAVINRNSTITNINDKNNPSKYLIVLPSSPMFNDTYLKANAKKGEYWLFAEHDNLGDFVASGSIFNIDSFRRKGPWQAFRPVMTRNLKNASDKDPLYANNIGCTLKHKATLYPLIWEYTPFGVPKLLAAGEFLFHKRFTYIGDSDAVVKFLISYNTHFIQALFGKPDLADFLKGLLLILCVILSFGFANESMKRNISLLLFILCCVVIAALPNAIAGKPVAQVDVSMQILGNWLSPHIATHYSSLPKNLSQQDLTVAIDQADRPSKLSVMIVANGTYSLKEMDFMSGRKMVMLMPNGKLKIGKDLYTVNDVPLGELKAEIFGAIVYVPDAREISLNGKKKDFKISLNDRLVVIGTNSPQLIKGIGSVVRNDTI